MAQNITVTYPANTWTQITDTNVVTSRIQNQSLFAVNIAGTSTTAAPTSLSGSIELPSGETIAANITLSQLFPGVPGVNRLWVYPAGYSSVLSISHADGGADGGVGFDRELAVTTYTVKTAFTGASVGHTITCTQVIDVTSTPTTIATIWRNQTTATDLVSAPSAANLEIVGSTALTDAQLRATAVPVSVTGTTGLTDTQLRAAAVPVSVTGTTGLTDTQLRATAVPVSVPATAAFGSGTREHDTANMTRQAVGSVTARVALPTLGTSREIYVMPNARCFFRTGDSTVTAAAGTAHPLAQDERFYLRVPAGHTHIAYIRDTADGFINVCAVV